MRDVGCGMDERVFRWFEHLERKYERRLTRNLSMDEVSSWSANAGQTQVTLHG